MREEGALVLPEIVWTELDVLMFLDNLVTD